ncbi:hypothetical protein ACFPAG_08005 [Vogesella sp. GCM10023246]|uniref:Seryl-tRNA synthetase n=1 Tax=Vogesella oryzagri TaxID=3160864 RepID=A0ABV1M4I1_9NEIS
MVNLNVENAQFYLHSVAYIVATAALVWAVVYIAAPFYDHWRSDGETTNRWQTAWCASALVIIAMALILLS